MPKVPPLIGFKNTNFSNLPQNAEEMTEAEGEDLSITNKKIDEVSNEVEESNDQKSKSEQSENENVIESSSSHESDYINEKSNKYHMNIVQSNENHIRSNSKVKIVVQASDENKKQEDTKVHPFMLESVIEEKRRMSSAIAEREMILSYVATSEAKN